jgi:predicted nucleic acid-binding protein
MTERALLDTNVLVYALYGDAKHHRASRALLVADDDQHAQAQDDE